MTLSNSVLVISPSDADGNSDQVVIQDSLNELLELVPTVPRLHRLRALLKEHELEEGHDEEDDYASAVCIFILLFFFCRANFRKCWTQKGHFLGETKSIYGRASSRGAPS